MLIQCRSCSRKQCTPSNRCFPNILGCSGSSRTRHSCHRVRFGEVLACPTCEDLKEDHPKGATASVIPSCFSWRCSARAEHSVRPAFSARGQRWKSPAILHCCSPPSARHGLRVLPLLGEGAMPCLLRHVARAEGSKLRSSLKAMLSGEVCGTVRRPTYHSYMLHELDLLDKLFYFQMVSRLLSRFIFVLTHLEVDMKLILIFV